MMQISVLNYMVGDLVRHWGISESVAVTVVHLIVNGGAWYVGVLYPYLLPLVATGKALIATLSVGVAVGW